MRHVMIVLSALFLAGCTTTAKDQTMTKTELKYKTILVLPIVEGTTELRKNAFNSFYNNLKMAEDIKLIAQEEINSQYLTNIGLENPEKYSVIDFSVNEKGLDHR